MRILSTRGPVIARRDILPFFRSQQRDFWIRRVRPKNKAATITGNGSGLVA